jgi:hypothetical protein
MIHIIFLIFFCSFFQSIDCTQWKFTAVDQIDVLRDAITEPFLLTHLSYKSDSTLSRKEFEYLTELTVNQEVSSDDVCQALSYLFQKKSFDAIWILF